MKYQIHTAVRKGTPSNQTIASNNQELRRQGWIDKQSWQKCENRGEPTSDAGSHILTIINLTPHPNNRVQLNYIILKRLQKFELQKYNYENWNYEN